MISFTVTLSTTTINLRIFEEHNQNAELSKRGRQICNGSCTDGGGGCPFVAFHKTDENTTREAVATDTGDTNGTRCR